MDKLLYVIALAGVAWFLLKRLDPQSVRAGETGSTFLTDLEQFSQDADAALAEGGTSLIDYYSSQIDLYPTR